MAKKKGSNSSNKNNGSAGNKGKETKTGRKKTNIGSTTPYYSLIVPGVIGVVIASIAAYYVSNSSTTGAGSAPAIHDEQCGLYIAQSTLPGAGLGMYAGRSYEHKEYLGMDHIVPLFDMKAHQGSGWPFLWNSYTWNARGIMSQEAHQVDETNHGFGSLANSFMDLWNVEQHETQKDETIPPNGGSSPYYQHNVAREDLQQGQELFVNYGDNYFLKRASWMGLVPLQGDVPRANYVLQKWDGLREKHGLSKPAFRDFWESIVSNNPFAAKSRTLLALPQNWTKIEDVLERKSLKKHLQHESIRSIEWLEENGMCADNMKVGPSPISGKGAFATRYLKKGKAIATMPLIHVPFRSRFEMGSPHKLQLLLNYCYGHRESTVLLCPYAPRTSFINHDHYNPNVKIVWGNPQTSSSHDPTMLKTRLDDMYLKRQSAALAFEVVTLRAITPGEEIVLDYGKEWEDAWQHHVQTVPPVAHRSISGHYYSSDLHAPDAFRHDIRIPDEMMPKAWKNVRR